MFNGNPHPLESNKTITPCLRIRLWSCVLNGSLIFLILILYIINVDEINGLFNKSCTLSLYARISVKPFTRETHNEWSVQWSGHQSFPSLSHVNIWISGDIRAFSKSIIFIPYASCRIKFLRWHPLCW